MWYDDNMRLNGILKLKSFCMDIAIFVNVDIQYTDVFCDTDIQIIHTHSTSSYLPPHVKQYTHINTNIYLPYLNHTYLITETHTYSLSFRQEQYTHTHTRSHAHTQHIDINLNLWKDWHKRHNCNFGKWFIVWIWYIMYYCDLLIIDWFWIIVNKSE